MRLRLFLPGVTAVAAVVVLVASNAAPSESASGSRTPSRSAAGGLQAPPNLPPPPASALVIPPPRPLGEDDRAVWAPVLRASPVHRRPLASSAVVGSVATSTPEGTQNIVAVLDRRSVADVVWVRVRIASMPNSRTGWLRRSALGGYTTVDQRLVIDRARHTATLLHAGRAVLVLPVAVGAAATPTPAGEFYIRNRLTSYASPAYGPLAFGTSARSAVLTDWPAGGFIGIHGTDRPDLVPGSVSHGCIRLRNADLLLLADRLEIGTPITIE